jgi:phage pi2 protein 07
VVKILQKLKAEIVITIPEDMVLIKRVEYEELKQNELSGVYWSMKELEKRINKKSEWIKVNILYPERFRKVLDVNNGGFVYYPENKGQPWSFQAIKMATFLGNNFGKIFSSSGNTSKGFRGKI